MRKKYEKVDKPSPVEASPDPATHAPRATARKFWYPLLFITGTSVRLEIRHIALNHELDMVLDRVDPASAYAAKRWACDYLRRPGHTFVLPNNDGVLVAIPGRYQVCCAQPPDPAPPPFYPIMPAGFDGTTQEYYARPVVVPEPE